MLTNEELSKLNARFENNANALISARQAGSIKAERSATGSDYEKLANPFAGYIVCPMYPVDNASKDFTLYPRWCLDVVEGVARLNWYRPEGDQRPLSVKKILLILQTCKQIDKYTIGEMFGFDSRQAERYVQAVRIIIPQHTVSKNQPIYHGPLEHSVWMVKPESQQVEDIAAIKVNVKADYVKHLQDERAKYEDKLRQQLIQAQEEKDRKAVEQAKAKQLASIEKQVRECYAPLVISN